MIYIKCIQKHAHSFKVVYKSYIPQERRKIMKKEYWALLVFVLIIVLQWIGLGFHGQIRFIFLIIILVLIVLFAILLRK